MKSKKETKMLVYNADIEKRIVSVRGLAVLLDADVADIYGVETKRVNEAVRNNPDKFPADYMLQLTKEESAVLRSKISTMEDLRSKISSTNELNFFIGKIKHTVKRVKRAND